MKILEIKELKSSTNRKGKDYKLLPEHWLNDFEPVAADLFLQDGIDENTQKVFDIRYDSHTNRLIIPIRNHRKELVGLLARLNSKDTPKNVTKYTAFISYPHSLVLFGMDKNLESIKERGYAIIVESEKSVMKAYQKGIKNVVACSGSRLFEEQIELLIELGITDIIISMDSDQKFSKLMQYAATVMKQNAVLKIRVHNTQDCEIDPKSCVFDMDWDKDKILSHIENFSF